MAGTHISALFWLVFALGLAAGLWLNASARRVRVRRQGRATNARAQRGESLAHQLLVAKGYEVLARQKRISYTIEIDDTRRSFDLIMDYEVQRRGEIMVAEVKTGPTATRIETAETRRQLLEYQLATGCKRVVLVDPDAGTVREVAFPVSVTPPARTVLWSVLVTLVLLVAALIWRLARR